MTKYTVVGVLNLFFGLLEVVWPLMGVLFVVPKLSKLFSNLNLEASPSFFTAYLGFGLILLTGLGNLFIGYKLVSKSENKEKYFKYGVTLLVIGFILGGIFASTAVSSMVGPIYNVNSQY